MVGQVYWSWRMGFGTWGECVESLKIWTILSIPYEPQEGKDEKIDVKICINELSALKDAQGNIRYEKIVDFLIPNIKGEGCVE